MEYQKLLNSDNLQDIIYKTVYKIGRIELAILKAALKQRLEIQDSMKSNAVQNG